MSASQQAPRRKSTVKIILVLLAGFGIGYITSEIVGFVSGLAPEYGSAAAIREITGFVEQKKAWPTSWKDLGMEPLNRVNINWSLDLDLCDRYDVMTSVAPATGSFYTYPHAERQLRDLWEVVMKIQGERSNQAVN
jgi:hypothetical protein